MRAQQGVTLVDKLMSLVLALAGTAGLVIYHVSDGAQTVCMFIAVAGATGVVGMQVVSAILHTMASSFAQAAANGQGSSGQSPTGGVKVID